MGGKLFAGKIWRSLAALCAFFLAGIFSLSEAASEEFSVSEVDEVIFEDITQAVRFRAGLDDAIHVNLPEDMTYVCGIEINLKIPEEIAAWRDSVAYSLYELVIPQGRRRFSGRRISYATIPGRLSLNVYIPLTDEFSIKDSPYSERIPVRPSLKRGDIFFRLQTAMAAKDLPDYFQDAQLEVSVKPVLVNKGRLNLSIVPASPLELPSLSSQKNGSKGAKKGGSYTLYIDDVRSEVGSLLLLPAGEHHVSVVSEDYRNELRTFIVEQARTTNLSIELRGIEPTLTFVCPKTTEIFFDETRVENPKSAFLIDPGEHSVKMVVGDYEIVRSFVAANGKSYTIRLDIDASIYDEK